MKILVIGDVVGSPGRAIVKKALPKVVARHSIDYTIANIENAAGGFGITKDICDEFLDQGVDCLTSGNHVWDKKELIPVADFIPQLLRPANYPKRQPGKGAYLGKAKKTGVPVGVLNLSGRVFMNGAMDCPFSRAEEELVKLKAEAKVIVVDMHAEATSEKMAMGYFLDGQVSAVVGTHTHVPTCDHRVFVKGTAYCTDIGMTGPYDSVIGVETSTILLRFTTGMPHRFETAKHDARFAAVVLDVDPESGRSRGIDRMLLSEADVAAL